MKHYRNKFFSTLAGIIIALGTLPGVHADDTDIYFTEVQVGGGAGGKDNPNVIFTFDTSGSMEKEETTNPPWDPNTTWAGDYDSTKIYWSADGSIPPSGTTQYVAVNNYTCAASFNYLDNLGSWKGKFLNHTGTTSPPLTWVTLKPAKNGRVVECADDVGVHGRSNYRTDRSDTYTLPNTHDGGPGGGDKFHATTSNVSWNNVPEVTVYLGNWLNWYHSETQVEMARIDILKGVMRNFLVTAENMNVAFANMCRWNGGGGAIIQEMQPITDDNRFDMIAAVDSLVANGGTPASETYWEAIQYMMGNPTDFGTTSTNAIKCPVGSVAASRVGNNLSSKQYKSPIVSNSSCAKNYAVLIGDGNPGSKDNYRNAAIMALPGFEEKTGKTKCDGPYGKKSNGGAPWGDGQCYDELASWAYQTDLMPGDDVPGVQNLETHVIGFIEDLDILRLTGEAGGGGYYTAENAGQLSAALASVLQTVIDDSVGSFVAPAVPVNSYNRMQNLNDVYLSLFEPSIREHWAGNVKRFRLKNGALVDKDDVPAIDPATGLFKDVPDHTPSHSYWSDTADGANVVAGGAANELPAYTSGNNRVFSNLTGDSTGNLFTGGNATVIGTSNPNLTKALLGIPASAPDSTVDEMALWLKGKDVFNHDDDDATVNRMQMGATIHSSPVPLYYSDTAGNEFRVFTATTDGLLHAINPADGSTAWSFIPRRLLDRSWALGNNPTTSGIRYGLGGQTASYIMNDDYAPGITGTEQAFLVLSQRRGGRLLWGLDVTQIDGPKLLWVIDPDDGGADARLASLAQTWSTPSFSKVKIGGTEKHVAIIGGGYDNGQDNVGYLEDNLGNAIYMIDVTNGDVVWSGGGDTTVAHNLSMNMANGANATMLHSVPAPVKAVDLTGDGLLNRMYVTDMGGRIWRFDVDNSAANANELVSGGLIASLGAAESGADADARRFYASPDVVPVISDDPNHDSYLAINVGSGHRAKPLDTSSDDWFFSVRDKNMFGSLETNEYDADYFQFDDLDDITDTPTTTLPNSSNGWKLELEAAGGERVLNESFSLKGTVFFTTFTPSPRTAVCGEPTVGGGDNRLYRVSVTDGRPLPHRDNIVDPDDPLTKVDRYEDLAQNGIAPAPTMFFTDDTDGEPVLCVGVECETSGLDNSFTPTYWFQDETQ